MDYFSKIGVWISPDVEKFLIMFLIMAVTIISAKIFRKILDKSFKKSAQIMKIDVKQYNFVKHLLVGVVYILGLSASVYAIPELRALSVSILAGAGVLAIVVGFASQQAFSNIVSGIFIFIFKPFKVGDYIQMGQDMFGRVEDMTLRHAIIVTSENKRLYIPNSVINNEVI